jgi:hypothetical protein
MKEAVTRVKNILDKYFNIQFCGAAPAPEKKSLLGSHPILCKFTF